jgi:hypothetical protein
LNLVYPTAARAYHLDEIENFSFSTEKRLMFIDFDITEQWIFSKLVTTDLL